MIVLSLFDGDQADVGWQQHDVYNRALDIIVNECRGAVVRAATILALEPPSIATALVTFDHRDLQMAHDIMAATWRFRSHAIQAELPVSGAQTDLMTDWLNWLRAEVISWQETPKLIQLVIAILGQVDSVGEADGVDSVDQLTYALLGRYDDVPWSKSIQELFSKIEFKTETRL
ncbi:MAG: hypothetical protein ING71_05155 [Rhodocyclaceae bacterium]|nr:hypothetical protein [Rhodocyclaceae bacterium]